MKYSLDKRVEPNDEVYFGKDEDNDDEDEFVRERK